MHHGVVKFFNTDQGFGFISPISGGRDVLVQAKTVEQCGLGELLAGQRVAFSTAGDDAEQDAEAILIELLAANEDDGRLRRFG